MRKIDSQGGKGLRQDPSAVQRSRGSKAQLLTLPFQATHVIHLTRKITITSARGNPDPNKKIHWAMRLIYEFFSEALVTLKCIGLDSTQKQGVDWF